jgi:dihydrodipicolinate synthase/N-acetylneuraminate lyase
LGLGASNCDKNNTIDTTTARILSMNFSVNYTRENKGSITFDSRLIKNKYDDNAVTSASSYQMLEGLNNGINGVVTINANYMITQYLQLTLLYELRTSKISTLHTGEMALKLVF